MDALHLECTLGQPFARNYNPLYHAGGLLGHTGYDESCGYGSDIHSYVNGYVYSLYTPEKPASDGFTAIYMLCETPLETYEFCVGHVSEINVKIGDTVKIGDVIGKEGNHGQVFQGGQQITLAMQKAGDKRGSHRHVQKRVVERVMHTTPGRHYLQTEEGILVKDGSYFEIPLYDNGFNGCVDFMRPLFDRDLFFGRSGYDVLLLQKALVKEGLFAASDCIGTFGPRTLAAVQALQRKWNINPTLGYVGTLTRARLNSLYPQL